MRRAVASPACLGDFGVPAIFGLVGVFVVAALVAVIATDDGQGESNPKLALGLIFGVIAVFVVVLLAAPALGPRAGGAADAGAADRAAAEGGRQVENPTTLAEPALWAAMAIAPIDADAVRAREEVWDVGRRSQRLGAVVFALIFLTVPPSTCSNPSCRC